MAGLTLTPGVLSAAQPASGTLSGTVTEAGNGAPLADVAVHAFCWQVDGFDPGEACGETQTAIDGTYSLQLPPGTFKVLFDDWPNHGARYYGGGTEPWDEDSLEVAVANGGSTPGIDAALVPLRSISGTVTGNGEPVGGIIVTAYRLSGGLVWNPVYGTVTQADGSYALHVPDGTYRVGFSDAHGPYRTLFFDGAASVEQATDVVVAGGPIADIDADMALDYPITGKVTVDGVDMPNMAVTAWRRIAGDWESVKWTSTGTDGTYALYLADGTYRVEFKAWQSRFDPVYYDGADSLDNAVDVVVAGAAVPNIDAAILSVVPESGPAITGTVTVAGTGGAASGVAVTAWRWSEVSSEWQYVRDTFTRPEDGGYALYVPEGTYRVEFRNFFGRYRPAYYDGADTLDAADDVVVTSEGAPNVDAQLVENPSITGTVTADPVPELPPGPPPTAVTAWQWNEDLSQWVQAGAAFSTPDGSYALYLPDGTYRIEFNSFYGYRPVYYDGADEIDEADDVLLAGANVPNVDAHLEPWPASAIVSGDGESEWDPQVAVGPDGAATAVWTGGIDGHHRVQASTWTIDGALAGAFAWPVALSQAGEDAWDPQVATGAQGAAVVVWRRWDGTHYRVQAAIRPVHGWWSYRVTLSEAGEDAWDPQVAMSANGRAVVVWRRWDGTAHQVQATTRAADGPWSSPITLSTAGEDAWDPQIAVRSDGTATAVWSRSNGTDSRVQATSRAASGAWSSPVTLSAAGGDAWSPQVAAGPNGATTVVWHRWDGSSDRIEAASRARDGDWSPPATLSAAGQDAYDAQVAMDPDGMVTAAWSWRDGEHDRVQAASRAPGGIWSAPTTLSKAGREARSPQVAPGPDGTATVVWRQSEGISERVEAAARCADGSWSVPSKLAEGSERADRPQVAAGADGTLAVVWERRDFVGDRIQAVVLVPVSDSSCLATTSRSTSSE